MYEESREPGLCAGIFHSEDAPGRVRGSRFQGLTSSVDFDDFSSF